MAHECPECSMRCHCNGDIDDIVLKDVGAENNCTHCLCKDCGELVSECECFEEDDYNEDQREF